MMRLPLLNRRNYNSNTSKLKKMSTYITIVCNRSFQKRIEICQDDESDSLKEAISDLDFLNNSIHVGNDYLNTLNSSLLNIQKQFNTNYTAMKSIFQKQALDIIRCQKF